MRLSCTVLRTDRAYRVPFSELIDVFAIDMIALKL